MSTLGRIVGGVLFAVFLIVLTVLLLYGKAEQLDVHGTTTTTTP